MNMILTRTKAIERLEQRALLSAVVIDRTLFVEGSSAADQIQIDTDGSVTSVKFQGLTVGTFADADFDRIDVRALGGADSITLGIAVVKPSTLDGGAGNDSMTGGGGDDVLIGGPGSDWLNGGGTPDVPGGLNTADFSDRPSDLNFANGLVSDSTDTDTLGGNLQTVISGSGNDNINFGYNPLRGATQYLDAGPGNDQISMWGYWFDPTIHGGAGDDQIFVYAPGHTAHHFGDAGDDYFRVQRSSFTTRIFHGGDGIDTVDWTGFISGSWAVSVTFDGIANDGAYAEYHNQGTVSPDNVFPDIERIIGTSGGDTMIGTDHDETLIGNGGPDILQGAGGDDSLEGNSGDDTLDGGPGRDTLAAGAGTDSLITDPDDIVTQLPVTLRNGVLSIDGEDTDDVVFISMKSGDPGTLVVSAAGETGEFPLAGMQRIYAGLGYGNDLFVVPPTLTVPLGIDTWWGDDTVFGGAGPDTLLGQGGNDSLVGGAGNDSLSGADDHDTLIGGDGVDSLVGHGGNDYLDGGAGADSLYGDAGNSGNGTNPSHTSDGNDTLIGGDGADYMWAAWGDDFLFGENGADTLIGDRGNDYLDGGRGDDSLEGDEGDDALVGGLGIDVLDGGSGMNVLIDDLAVQPKGASIMKLFTEFDTNVARDARIV
jgi:Ca2+-binding RTX toxin-like protein